MARKSPRLCHWLLLLLSEFPPWATTGWARDVGATASAASAPANRAGDVTLDSADSAAAGMALVLSVTLNGQDAGLAQFHSTSGAIWATRDTLRRIGLLLPADAGDLIRLDTLAGVTVQYDEGAQAIGLTVPAAMLDAAVTHIGTAIQANPKPTASAGLMLDYDAYANFAGGDASFNSFTELRAFRGNSVLDSTALVSFGGATGAGTSNVVRLDTAWSTSFPDKLLTLRIGDTLTAATDWSRATRIGGIQFGTNFALQPYMVTVPMPSFLGSATLPSKVDLYIDGVKRYSGDVPAGPFSLNAGANRINGAGTAQVVLTDMLGQVSTLNFSLYDTPQLLKQGLSDWSVELGAVRRNYGIRSFDYGNEPVVSATWRHGLTNWMTIESHGEADRSLADLGAGGIWLLGARGGILSASIAGSQGNGRTGYQWGLGYSWNNQRLNFQAQTLRSSASFTDIATRWSLPPARVRDYAQIGYDTRAIGSLGVNYIHEHYAGQPSYRYAGLYWSRPLGRHLALNLSANQDLDNRRDRALFLTLNFAPRGRDYFSASYGRQNGADGAYLTAQRNVSQDGGLGWRVDARHDDSSIAGTAQLDYLSAAGEVHAGIGAGDGPATGFLGYSGSLVLMDGHVFAARHIDDSFAVVSTGDVPDVPVKLENNPIGHTGANGLLLVPRLNAYQSNLLSIDPTDLPATARVDKLDLEAVPTDRAGVLVHFSITSFGALVMTLVDKAGEVVPEGSAVHVIGRDGEPLVVGFGGQLYVENPRPRDVLSVELPDGTCQVPLPASPPTNSIARLGVVQCLPEHAP